MNEAKTIAFCNQKGGVGKTVSTGCLGVSLAAAGKRVLLVDFDPQGNLTKGLGFKDKSLYKLSAKDLLLDQVKEVHRNWQDYIVSTDGLDLLPSNINLAGMDLQLVGMMCRETLLKRALDQFKPHYDYILIDSNPTLSLFTINTLVAADSIIVPMQPEPYPTDGLEDLLQIVHTAKKQLNPNLEIEGILITMIDRRTKLSKHISSEVRAICNGKINVFQTEIPRCIKTAEASLYGKSPITYAPNSESAQAYRLLAKEVLNNGEGITKTHTEPAR